MEGSERVLVDDGRGRFGPLTDLRPAFDLRSGVWTLRQRVTHRLGPPAALLVPAGLEALTREAADGAAVNPPPPPPPEGKPICWISARCARPAVLERAARLPVGAALVQPDGQVVAAHTPPGSPPAAVMQDGRPVWRLPQALARQTADPGSLLERPWQLIEALEDTLRDDLDRLDLPEAGPLTHVARLGAHPVRLAPTARVHPMVVLNAEKGPIAIDDGAIIGSFSVLAGPCYVGPGTIVSPHTHLRAGSSLGPHCVAGGEIVACVFQGYANKSHAGFLGQSLVGEWVNLGADTNASNLKNTYGPVRMQLEPDSPAEDTGQLKLGPILGDHVRTAIGTRLLSGSCLGTGTMLALSGFAPKFTPPLRFLIDEGDQPYDVDRFLRTARTVLSRRKRELTPALEARLRTLAPDPQPQPST